MRISAMLFMIALSFSAMAQQDPIYAQYMLNPVLINPAYAGLNNEVNISAGYRTQWTSLEGQPQTLMLSGNTSLLNNKAGAGVLIVNDRIGNVSNLETNVQFAYKLNLDETTLSFGMQAGVQKFTTDYGALTILDQGDNAFSGTERGSRLNLGAGAILKNENFFLGLSVPRLLPSSFNNGGQRFDVYNQHFYLAGAYVHYFNERVRFKPSVLLRAVKGAPASVDLSANLNVNALHTFGVFARNFKSYGLTLQTLIKDQLRFGYVFEMPTNKSIGSNFTTHEIVLGIRLTMLDFQETTNHNF